MRLESNFNIAKYILAFGSVQGLNIVIGVIRNKLVALLLGPNGMGIMALYSSSVQMIQNTANLGLDKSGIPSISRAFESGDADTLSRSVRTLRSLFVIASLIAFLGCILTSWLLSLIAFSDTSRTLHFIALSPTAALLIIAAGETVILKATRRLKRIAILSLLNVVLSLCVSVPMFYGWGSHAIIPSLVATALVQCAVTILYSYSVYRPQFSFTPDSLREGIPMIKLGFAFICSGAVTLGAEFLLRSYLNTHASDTVVGLYNAAFMIAFTYAGMVFAAVDSEYFPRLSGMFTDGTDRNTITLAIKRQIKVSLAIIIPMVIVLELLLPWIVPLLFSDRFVDAIPMAQVTLLAMLFRAAYLPLGYVPLAKGDSHTFLYLEIVSAVTLTASVIIGYEYYGLIGCGFGLVLSNAIDLINYIVTNRLRYGI